MDAEIAALRQAGLTEYGARAYVALLSLGGATAAEVAEAARVPRTRVYDVLQDLEVEGWVEAEPGRPRRYHGLDPGACLDSARQRLDAVLRDALPTLQARHTAREQRFAGTLWLLEGREAVLGRACTMMGAARKRVLWAVPLPEVSGPELVKGALRAQRRGVAVRVVARPGSSVGADLQQAGLVLHEGPVPVSLLVVDGKQSLIIMPVPRDGGVHLKAVWNPNPELASVMGESLPFALGLQESH